MITLSVDTSGRVGSLALQRDFALLDERDLEPRRGHGDILLTELDAMLGRAGMALRDIDLFVACTGPGSFTGLRVGLATVNALGWALGRPTAGIGSLEALASGAALLGGLGRSLVSPVIDARKAEVYAALYRCDGEALPVCVASPQVIAPERWSEMAVRAAAGEPVTFAGTGVEAYPAAFGAAGIGGRVRAAELGRLALVLARQGGIAALPPAIPRYVRPSEAEAKFGAPPRHDPIAALLETPAPDPARAAD